ncbi:MAG TPA: hypothetical protein VE973_03010 [Candidatus Limnocylindria bacterium]|nr:hypothetical protein [Candidatus Limnocylindria bacterium]
MRESRYRDILRIMSQPQDQQDPFLLTLIAPEEVEEAKQRLSKPFPKKGRMTMSIDEFVLRLSPAERSILALKIKKIWEQQCIEAFGEIRQMDEDTIRRLGAHALRQLCRKP